ncbi:non-ribosomal peptide synthetase, terminal component domain protein [Burkholderia pseudomallei]|nr:non-ribosomal peptide synthetase, terminal component domain protein [Burkholderia pseudomallei]
MLTSICPGGIESGQRLSLSPPISNVRMPALLCLVAYASSASGVTRKPTSSSCARHQRNNACGSEAASPGASDRQPPLHSAAQTSHVVASNATPATLALRQPVPTSNAPACHATRLQTLRCSTITPFGCPVEPDV